MKDKINKNTEIDTRDPILRKAIYESYFGKCFYTGQNVKFNEMHIDHVIPKTKGGKNCISNYVLSSQFINKIKTNNIHKDLIKVTLEVVNSLFSEKVVNIYNDLSINQDIIDGYIELNEFLLSIKDNRLKSTFRSYVNSTLIPIRIYPLSKKYVRGKKPKLYYNSDDINSAFTKWLSVREKLNRQSI